MGWPAFWQAATPGLSPADRVNPRHRTNEFHRRRCVSFSLFFALSSAIAVLGCFYAYPRGHPSPSLVDRLASSPARPCCTTGGGASRWDLWMGPTQRPTRPIGLTPPYGERGGSGSSALLQPDSAPNSPPMRRLREDSASAARHSGVSAHGLLLSLVGLGTFLLQCPVPCVFQGRDPVRLHGRTDGV